MIIHALEMHLHRARRQLRQLLNTELRADTRESGLMPGAEVSASWRETRLWCMFCSHQRLQGTLVCFS